MRKICVITGAQAEYGLLRLIMQRIKRDSSLRLQIIVTGMHLSPDFGFTYHAIEQDGFRIDRKVEMLVSSDTAVGTSKSMGLGMIGFADALHELQPDLVLVLGDRFEIFSAASAALVAQIPVAHIHGGEKTEGAFDEALRHSITKMSHLHFVAAEEYRGRVIQLGEDPSRIFNVGGLGVDAITSIKLLDRVELERSMDLKFSKKNLLVTFHPVTLERQETAKQMQILFDALDELKDTLLIFTMPNADVGGKELFHMIEAFVSSRPHAKVFTSLGQLRYLSCMKLVDGVVGNSSSGLAEAPSMGVGTINIGDRQRGRISASSVINCAPTLDGIRAALVKLYEPPFRASLATTINPYGNGGASEKIVEVLKNYSLNNLVKKIFFDLPI